ncbi:ABC transporter substrate-binding protein [Planktothrix agardhii]|uniref:ABC transporter substrate-binding protein n=1 Tax=Planktothrix agardhii TaxID=1160 RepID=UPI001D09D1CD|nr:ABC transporter substrate-binding protein [Planktothrix agardhii]MCB8787903.1 ABC transporter substrate-binding protein [Planktothrix agardhii 1025]MCF3610329.1 ABC transporter substrate-binding protein [Planktothrix agardhii 1027]MCF3643926.1 ABC transporter substrate-binding protein [Planktothrix agardhii 1026]
MIPFKRHWFQKTLFILLALVMSACSTAQSQIPSRLVVATPSGPATFNPPLSQSAYTVFGYLYDPLIQDDPVTGELMPKSGLAESWQISDDKQKIIITLKDGLKWSDGKPLTVDDIIFTYNDIYLNDKIPSSFKDILRVGKSRSFPTVKKLDNRRVEFSVSEPFAPFLQYVAGLSILPAHILKDSITETDSEGNPKFLTTWGTDTNPQDIVGNGQYRIKSYTPYQRVILERNPYYWRKDEQGNPQPYIEEIVWQIIESTDTQLLDFRSGSLDTLTIQTETFPLLKPEEKRGKYTIYNSGPDMGTVFMSLNMNRGKNAQGKPFVDPIKSKWFNNKAFRQAVYYAINREAMKNNFYLGLGELQHSPLPVQSPFYLSPEAGLKTYTHNPEKARQMLIDAGFKYNNQGQLLDSEGNQVRFTLLTSAGKKIREQMATQINQDLGKIGIQVDLLFLSFNTLVERLSSSRNWDAYLGGFSGGGIEPHGGYNIWSVQGRLHTFNQGPQPGETGITDWQVSDWEQQIDDLFVKASQEFDPKKRKELYGKAQKIISEELPLLYMVNPLGFEAIRDRVEGVEYTPLGGGFWNLYELKIAE